MSLFSQFPCFKFDMQQGALETRQRLKTHSDMQHEDFLNLTREMEIM